MEVVEFETLNEGPVQHRRRGRACGVSRSDHDGVATTVDGQYRVGGRPRPRQLRPDQRAAQPVEKKVLGAFQHHGRYVVE